ncbi:MAG: hypothetical protein WA208_18600 [Thermoanaerobaculia bacterium]
MSELIFVAKFVGISSALLAGLVLTVFALKKFEPSPYTMKDAVASILGTHLGRLRFLFLAGTISLVLAMLYPGPALFIPEGAGETVREVGHHLWYGNSRPFVPSPPDHSTWFWAQVGFVYLGAFALYVVLALPNLLGEALKAGKSVMAGVDPGDRRGRVYVSAGIAGVAVILAFLLGRRTARV